MSIVTFTVTAAGLLNVDGADRNGLLLEGPQDAIKAGAALAFQDVSVVPIEEILRLTAENERLRVAVDRLVSAVGYERVSTDASGARLISAMADTDRAINTARAAIGDAP